MNDLLSASSLLMAIVAILFSLWFADIAKALAIVPKPHKEDNVAARIAVTDVFFRKAFPVAVMALAVALIFLPDALKLANESWQGYRHAGFSALEKYDAVATAYCFVSAVAIGLGAYMAGLAVKLWVLRGRLS